MKYILTAGWEDGIADLTHRLVQELSSKKKVLWLVCGGSNVAAITQIIDNIPSTLRKNLTITLADERYGEPGHVKSNWQQLVKAGFNGEKANLLQVLQNGLNFKQTLEHYKQLIEQAFNKNDAVIAHLGIGHDGNIAGILPESPAAKETEALVAGYKSNAYTHLTLTFPGLRQIDAAYAFAFGSIKREALKTLQTKVIDPLHQPAQILKQLPEAYVYSDQVGVN